MKQSIATILILSLWATVGFGSDSSSSISDWSSYREFQMQRQNDQDREAISYMVSGALVTIGSSIALQKTDDIFSRGILSVSQSFGIAGLGYGLLLYNEGDEESRFYNVIENSKSLTLVQKNEILKNRNLQNKEREKSQKWIRAATHATIAAVNFWNATHESDAGLQSCLYFIGGVNLVFAIQLSF